MSLRTQTRRLGVGIATGNTKGPIAQQTRNPFTARDARFQAIPMRRVGEGDDQREAHPSQVGPHDHLQRLLPPHHPLNLNTTRRRKRNEKSKEGNKDDLERRGSLRMTRGTNALLPRTLPPVGAGQTAGHVAKQGGLPRRKERSVTQSISFKRTVFQTLSLE